MSSSRKDTARGASSPRIAIVTVCFNDAAKMPMFFDSVRQWTVRPTYHLLVDNGSTDRSITLFQQHMPDCLVIPASANLGTTGAWNLGIDRLEDLECEYVMFLNLDVLLAADCLEILVEILESQANVAVASPLLLKSHQPSVIECLGTTIRQLCWTFRPNFKHRQLPLTLPALLDVGYADGGSSLFRMTSLRDVGRFDENLFMYCDDVDMCVRLRSRGFRVTASSGARAWHRHSELRLTAGEARPHQIYYMARNALYVARKHSSGMRMLAIYCCLAPRALLRLASLLAKHRNATLARAYVRALVDGLLRKMGRMS